MTLGALRKRTSSMERPDVVRPGDHPEPHVDLESQELPLRNVVDGGFRVHSVRYDPIYFGRSGLNRFDAPNAEFGIMYVGMDAHCAVVETFEFVPFTSVIAVSSVAHLSLARIETARPLQLVDLTADGFVRLGADARLTTGRYDISQRWSHAFWRHPSAPDGLLYRSRHDPSRLSAAIFERASDALTVTSIDHFSALGMRRLLQQIVADYGFVLVDD